MNRVRPWLVCLLPVVCIAVISLAAEPAAPKKAAPGGTGNFPKLQKTVTAAPTSRAVKVGPTRSSKVSTVPIQDDELESMITDLGYEVKVNTNTDPLGNERKYLNVAAANYWVDVYLWGGDSYDNQIILCCKLLDVPDLKEVPADKLIDLLAFGDNYYGHMTMEKDAEGNVKIKAIKSIANLNISPALLQQTIDNFDLYIVQTKSIWNTNNNWTK